MGGSGQGDDGRHCAFLDHALPQGPLRRKVVENLRVLEGGDERQEPLGDAQIPNPSGNDTRKNGESSQATHWGGGSFGHHKSGRWVYLSPWR